VTESARSEAATEPDRSAGAELQLGARMARLQRIVAELEREDSSGGFDMVRDFAYEAYYAHPLVLLALKRELGWDGVAPTTGSEMSGFDEGLLVRVKTLPPRYREVW
jgi:hypothetical protein